MKGDFSRDSFDPVKHFSRVLQQQGRVQLDADWNEQAAILLHYLRTWHWFRFVQLSLLLHLCRFLNQEELMEREAMVQNP
jgi:hypothetical protein